MSGAAKDGGPAFPVHPVAHERGDAECAALSGMTLRDYFAAKAVQGLLSQSMGTAFVSDPASGAHYAYAMADAMIRARENITRATK